MRDNAAKLCIGRPRKINHMKTYDCFGQTYKRSQQWLYAFREMKTRFVGKEMAHVPLAHCQRLINMHEINTEV